MRAAVPSCGSRCVGLPMTDPAKAGMTLLSRVSHSGAGPTRPPGQQHHSTGVESIGFSNTLVLLEP
jgi:hypothetical protein